MNSTTSAIAFFILGMGLAGAMLGGQIVALQRRVNRLATENLDLAAKSQRLIATNRRLAARCAQLISKLETAFVEGVLHVHHPRRAQKTQPPHRDPRGMTPVEIGKKS